MIVSRKKQLERINNEQRIAICFVLRLEIYFDII